MKVSKEQFAEVLYHWLSNFLTEKAVKKTAKEFGFKIKNNRDFNRIFQELFTLNMWLIVYTCELAFEDEDKGNECLDIFHNLIYERHAKDVDEDFMKWMSLMHAKYVEYTKAIETDYPSTPLWVLATLINKNLFGKIKKDPFLQTKIVIHVGEFKKHLRKAIKEYSIK